MVFEFLDFLTSQHIIVEFRLLNTDIILLWNALRSGFILVGGDTFSAGLIEDLRKGLYNVLLSCILV